MRATMELIMERGYSSTTTKDIAKCAKVNECTIFRKFKSKKDIVLTAMQYSEWNPDLRDEDFAQPSWDLKEDLLRFSRLYMSKVTDRFVRISIGLRTPELYPDTADGIMRIPETFKRNTKQYFDEMYRRGKLKSPDSEQLAMMLLSLNFGFVFLKASFGDKLTPLDSEAYLENTIQTFLSGVIK
ncbi:MAG: TetR/AcrR family transcriptional regulator [Butyricicoccaceae bacterium]